MSGNEELNQDKKVELAADKDKPEKQLAELLETVLDQTQGSENSESLELIKSIAQQSQYSDLSSIRPVKELVSAILCKRLGAKRVSPALLSRVTNFIFESPVAMNKLTRLWKEARGHDL